MMKVRIIILSLLLSLFFTSYASADIYDDDSCTGGTTIANRVIVNLTTAGYFSAYSANFYMDGAPDTQTAGSGCDANYYCVSGGGNTCTRGIHNSKSCPAGSPGCSSNACSTNGGLRFSYYALQPDLVNYGYYTYDATDGWGPTFFAMLPATIRVVKVADKLCVQFWTLLGYQTIGCKYLPDCSVFDTTASCYVAQSCASDGAQYSMGLLPITATIVQCIKESIQRLFVDVSACNDGSSTYQTNYFPAFQATMRRAVRAALMLYIILFGIKMALGGEMPDKGEFFKLGAKYILVLYFSVGIFVGNSGGRAVYSDGINAYMLPIFETGASDLANMVYSAAGVQGLCAYPPTGTAYHSGYSYLAFWDSLDCRILYYLGVDLSRIVNGVAGTVTWLILVGLLGAPTIVMIIIPGILSGQLIFAVFAIAFAMFVISIMIYILNITILSMIAVAILIYMAPIFVPMALFEVTKGYYDGWLKLLISYALQPMVMTAFMAMMITVFDQTMFGDCQFRSQSIVITLSDHTTKVIPFFVICDPHASGSGCTDTTHVSGLAQCKDTLGYVINPIRTGSSWTSTMSAMFFGITILSPNAVNTMFTGLVTLCLFAYLFYKFAAVLGQFASELTGGTNLGAMAGNPMKIVDAAATAAKAGIQYAMGDKKGAAETAMKGAKKLHDDKKNRVKGAKGQ